MNKAINKPDYLFETSWEVCNKVGGIHTVISTKASSIVETMKDNYILIGPDVWREGSPEHPEFTEDKKLLNIWKDQLHQDGLSVKIGRWNIAGNPVTILVDFTQYFSKKDEIFKRFWELYKLDSIAGQWDYIEPALFGYAAAKIIESFVVYNLHIREKTVAHFHEWMTGTGVLYIKEHVPWIATAFTTHATVIGRCLAGNSFPLYDQLKNYDAKEKAREFNVVAKQSLEKLAAQMADSFTTVSEITSAECEQFLGKIPDCITPNGFEDSFVPQGESFHSKRTEARLKLRSIAHAMLDHELPQNTLFISISGRYEFRNKGLDLLIDTLARLDNSEELDKNIVAFLLVPANNYGPRKDLLSKINDPANKTVVADKILTHNLHDADDDAILKQIKSVGLLNSPDNKVKIIFAPVYLDGNDGVFNLSYYDVLIGMDLTAYPSYYEPWGYTPMESLAFHVPTITTTLAGFGLWIKNNESYIGDALQIIHRDDTNNQEVVGEITNKIIRCTKKNKNEMIKVREEAFNISRNALWSNFLSYYFQAWHIALSKLESRADKISEQVRKELSPAFIDRESRERPAWKKVFVEKNVPESLAGLEELSNNLWWSWNEEAVQLFKSIDEDLWEACGNNPVALLESISNDRLNDLENDKTFIKSYQTVVNNFRKYLAKAAKKPSDSIAYFSMEYGIHDSLKIFSGGLGILAGDYLKEASDQNINLIGIGLLYRYGYFRQEISLGGEQLIAYKPQRFSQLPVTPVRDEEGQIKSVIVALPGRNLVAKIWQANVGRIPLYLLDTDHAENHENDRSITHHLYGGDIENRLKQEILLGIGGVRALALLGHKPHIYHNNEGHAAFSGLERMRRLIEIKNLSFAEALEIVRATTLFTTHTPVAAGHDVFTEDLLRTYLAHFSDKLKIAWEEFIALGKINRNDKDEKFSMSYLAANMAQQVNGVSELHGKVSRELFNPLWSGYFPEELHIGHVTNGVHYSTWTASKWKELYENSFSPKFISELSNKEHWEKIHELDDKQIWKIRESLRGELINYIRVRHRKEQIRRNEHPKRIVDFITKTDEKCLTIGFARRFATYKRAHLLFRNQERLAKIVNMPDRPVQFIFAGKAHPNDKAGQELIQNIVQLSKKPEFEGKIIFLENYDMKLAKKLVQGVDVWLNTPTRPLEASGTSGMKATLNGVLNFSILDGWWVEGYKQEAGWAISQERTYNDQQFQDEMDAENIYAILENQIVPLFYNRNTEEIPEGWLKYIKNSIALIAPEFTTTRMLNDYNNHFYEKLFKSRIRIRENDYKIAFEIARWKKKIYRAWEGLEIKSLNLPDPAKMILRVGEEYNAHFDISLNGLSPDDIGLELVIAEIDEDGIIKEISKSNCEMEKTDGNTVTYILNFSPVRPGILNYGIRIFPKNEYLAHRQDLNLIKWV